MIRSGQLRRSSTRLQKQGALFLQQTRGAGETFLSESRDAGVAFVRDLGAAGNKLAGTTGQSAKALRKALLKETLDWQRLVIQTREAYVAALRDRFVRAERQALSTREALKPEAVEATVLESAKGLLEMLRPYDMKYVTNLGSAHMLQGNFASAATYFQRAIDIKPTKNAYSNLGLIHFYVGDYDAAIESQRAAVELQPNDPLAGANLGDTLLAAGRAAEARQAFEDADRMAASALRVNPNDPLILMDMAWIKSRLGEQDEARRPSTGP